VDKRSVFATAGAARRVAVATAVAVVVVEGVKG